MEERRYTVPKPLLGEMLGRVERTNDRGRRLGCEPWTVASIEERREAVLDESGYKVGEREMATVTLRGEPPRVPGWAAVARIAWDLWAGPLIRSFDGTDRTPPAEAACEHCGRGGTRRVTYLVRSDGGREMQVGSTCVRDYTGLEPAAIDWYADEADGDLDRDFDSAPFDPSTDYLLALASVATRQHGWVSAAEAREDGGISTSRRVMLALELGLPRAELPPITPADRERAAGVRRLVLADGSGSEYARNLRAVLGAGTVSLANAPLAASAVAMAEWIERDEAIREALAAAGPPVPLPIGSGIDIEGVVAGVSPREAFNGIAWKMTVVGAGWRCWMTVPAALLDAVGDPRELEGRRVALRANVEASDDDPAFGFARRPRMARILD